MDKLTALIAKHEGLRLKPYECTAGKITIGYGRNLEDNGISKAEAESMLVKDITESSASLGDFAWFKGLDDVRKAVVVNMVYNLGMPRFKLFQNTIWYLSQGLYTEASIEMLDSNWAKQVGNRATELSVMMKTGKWS